MPMHLNTSGAFTKDKIVAVAVSFEPGRKTGAISKILSWAAQGAKVDKFIGGTVNWVTLPLFDQPGVWEI